MLVDSHCHLNFPQLAPRLDEILAEMERNGVGYALCVGVNLSELPRVIALAEQHPNIFASVGVHPDHAEEDAEPTADDLAVLANHPKVVAIGETGLDYYRLKGGPEWQKQRFRAHIRAARKCGKPLIIHTREAATDTLRILAEEGGGKAEGVMHCFTESWEVAQAALEMGLYISFSGIVTFKNAAMVRDVAQKVPLERLLIETDSPYLAPVPYRGKINQPAYVKYVAEEIARLRGISFEKVATATTRNFFNLFNKAANQADIAGL